MLVGGVGWGATNCAANSGGGHLRSKHTCAGVCGRARCSTRGRNERSGAQRHQRRSGVGASAKADQLERTLIIAPTLTRTPLRRLPRVRSSATNPTELTDPSTNPIRTSPTNPTSLALPLFTY